MIRTVLRRPRGTIVVFAALVLLAVVSMDRIPVEGTPETELPSLNVSTTWPGADPEAVCEQITRPIEEAARLVEGVEEISSSSRAGQSYVTVSFAKGTDMDVASMELTERISFLQNDLPSTIQPSTVTQSVPRDLESEGFLIYSISGAEESVLKQLAEEVVVPRLERIDGVSSVMVEGLGQEEIVVDIDLDVLRSLDLTLTQVAMAVQQGIVDRNVGVAVDTTGLEAVLRVSTVPTSPSDFGSIIVARRGDRFITISDVATRITQGFSENTAYIFRYNGLDQVSIEVDRTASSNAVRVAGRVRREVEDISRDLPAGVTLDLIEDGTEQITNDLEELSWRALLALGAIMFVLLLLNSNVLTTPIILSSIILSAALAVTAVYLAGYSINVLTLSALAIAFGLLVDGAVVVMESIAFQRRQGNPPLEAAMTGATSVSMPILGGILTTMVAFVPLLASEGVLKLYYRPFAFTIAATLTASYLVCLTLVPSIAGHWKAKRWFRERRWDRALARGVSVLHHKPMISVIFTVLLIAAATWIFITKVEKGRNWGFDFSRETVNAWVRFPPGTPQDIVDGVAMQFEHVMANREGVKSTRTQVWGEQASVWSQFTDDALRDGTALQVEAEAVALATTIGGIQSIWVGGISPEGYWRSTTSAGMMQQVELRGYDYEGLKRIAEGLRETLERHPRIGDVNIDWNMRILNREQLAVTFDRQELADLGINPYQVLMALRYNLSGGYGAQVRIADETMDMTFRIEGEKNPELDDVLDSRILTSTGTVRLGDVVSVDTMAVQGSVERDNGEYIRTVAYAFMGAERMAARFRMTLLDNLVLPSGYRVYEDTTWLPRWLREEDTTDMNLLVILAILAVFAVTAIVFESFTAPLYVLAVIPMAMVGVVAGFWIFGKVFTPEAYVGSVFLVGIAVNNSILLVDSFEKKKKAGIHVREAVDIVVSERLRPILLTTLTTIAGLLPLVLWPISATDLWGTLSFTVVCGLTISAPLVLITLPSLIQLTSRKRRNGQ
jgi:HAE1 family hydrophobic/amphiphilic exporter-1